MIDTIVEEPIGGAQREPRIIIDKLAEAVDSTLSDLLSDRELDLKAQRRDKFLAMGKKGFN